MKKTKTVITILMILLILVPVFAFDKTQAQTAIQKAEEDIAQIKQDELSATYFDDLLFEANKALERAEFAELLLTNTTGELAEKAKKALQGLNYEGFKYEDVLDYTDEIATRKQRAYAIKDTIELSEQKITEYSQQEVDTTKAKEQLQASKQAFQAERYAEAEEKLKVLAEELERKRAEVTALRIALNAGQTFVTKYWPQLLLFVIIMIVIGMIVEKKLRKSRLRKKIKYLKAQQKAVDKLVKKVQKQRYGEGSIPKLVYDIRMKRYRKKENNLKREIPVLKAQLRRM